MLRTTRANQRFTHLPLLGLRRGTAVPCSSPSTLLHQAPVTPSTTTTSRSLATRYPRAQYGAPHNYYRPRRNWTKILLSVFAGCGVVIGGLWWFYWPHHTFSTEVAKILRKGLWAESERGGYDYQKALQYYLEALDFAKKQDLDPLSDEFTGIQLKIGEMYERMSMNQDALMVYSEISAAYLNALTQPGAVPSKLRPHLIQKDLRVVIKSVELNVQNPQMCKMILLTHLLVAQEEVSKRSATAAELISKDHPRQGVEHDDEPSGDSTIEVHDPQLLTSKSIKADSTGKDGVIVLQHNREAWEPFADELFNARDIYVAICLASGDIASAARAKTASTEWMLNADRHPGEILMSQTNLGSIMYLNAQAFEDKLVRGKKSGVPDSELEYDRAALQQSLTLAIRCYESVLDFAKKLPVNLRREDRLEESIALSTYGLGVVRLHNGDLVRARTLLREARLRAKGSGFDDLVIQAEEELQKVTKAIEERAAEEAKAQGKSTLNDNEDEIERIKKLLEEAENQEPKSIDFTVQLGKRTDQ